MNNQNTINDVQFLIRTAQSNILNLETTIKNGDQFIKKSQKDSIKLVGAKELLEVLKDTKMNTKKEFILDTINTALMDIFKEDLKIDIESETSEGSSGKISIKYNIVLYQNGIEMARNEKLLGNNGGGVLSVISILFKMIVGYIYSDNKFYMFDESVSQVSADYRPNLGLFLHKFCQTYNFTLVLVNHNSDMDQYADIVYYLDAKNDESNVPSLYISSKEGEVPTKDYYKTKIINFQSIEKAEFKYKGLTIIRGRSNIGKSASLRAVTSLLFNTFDVKDHPRKLRKRGSPVSVSFEYVKDDSAMYPSGINPHQISLNFKNNKVVYSFDGMDFAGKSLAFEKVKEKVETIGFKYVDIGKTYKNFKGNIKDQTERLAATTQHDGFYLIGSKSNEIEKVFNFLFDTYKISGAIALIKQDILNLETQINEVNSRLSANRVQLKREQLKEQMYNKKYIMLYIESYGINIKLYDEIQMKEAKRQIIIDKLLHYIQVHEYLVSYQNNEEMIASYNLDQLEHDIQSFQNLIELKKTEELIYQFKINNKSLDDINSSLIDIDLKSKKIEILLDKLDLFSKLNTAEYKNNISKINSYNYANKIINDKIDILNTLLTKLNSVNSINPKPLQDLLIQEELLINDINNFESNIEILNKEYQLCQCGTCHGSGVSILN